jgi:signal transduction histidine kinase
MAEILRVKSLQRKVAVITSLAVAAALVLGVGGARMAEEIEQRQHLDMHLEEVAQTVLEFAEDEAKNVGHTTVPHSLLPRIYLPNEANSDLTFQVWLKDGPVLLQTNDGSSTQPLMPLTTRGFDSGMVKGREGRKFSLAAQDDAFIVQVAEQFEDHDRDTPTLLRFYFLPIALPLLLSMLATWVLLRRSAGALDDLVYRLRHVDILDLGTVEIDRPTHEIRPVIEEVNSLFKKASNAITTEQRFTSMAAHELRTPWAGIKAQAQLALKARNAEDLHEALRYLIGGVDRASHVFDQLFDLSRLEATSSDIAATFGPVAIAEVYHQVMDDLSAKASARGISSHTRFDAPTIEGLDFAFFLLLRNLLSNAIQYGPDGGHIEVSTHRHGLETILNVDDSGKGISAAARQSAFERFNRLDQHGPDGVGLGLSIVLKCVELQRGRIELLESPLGGLRVQLRFANNAASSAAPASDK